MKKSINLTFTMLIALFIGLGLTSCTGHYVKITAQTSCSPDLLEFVTPIVTITGENGESSSFELSSSEFTETEEEGYLTINATINGESVTIESTAINNVAECSKKFTDMESIKGDIQVRYMLKSDYVLEKDKYVFFHGVGYKYKTDMIELLGAPVKPIANEISKDNVMDYLDKLIAHGDSQTFDVK